ncbi:glutathione S-transferase T2-like [Brassica rapa]|nr:glutathione S-transferase T2-like [Brassica rapa]
MSGSRRTIQVQEEDKRRLLVRLMKRSKQRRTLVDREMDYNPFTQSSNFVGLLTSQQSISFGSSQVPTPVSEDVGERRERKKWTPSDDILLISSWLNTSKDPIVGNEQRSGTFWTRIAAYYAASQKVAGCEEREAGHCKQRWHRINDLVCKFCGSYEAAKREKTSGCNENDVLKKAHEIFYNNYNKKFNLEHAWKELRNDQKWSDQSSAKNEGNSSKRKGDDGGETSNSQGTEPKRPAGVKASKASGKKNMVEEKALKEFESMWAIKQQDLAAKDKLSRMRLLESLVSKKEPLAEYEEALKKKIISDIMFN